MQPREQFVDLPGSPAAFGERGAGLDACQQDRAHVEVGVEDVHDLRAIPPGVQRGGLGLGDRGPG
ncbi:hypothetical protein [Amycolatopsis alkalitolerans]|uniref:Uncharacterized protein n=1 Tax=Amycolatopsis alkalitolerans TaxID=2547244 RepID=A0A5C4LVS8_9PSEU|nr:hypothetical protein [Amycolatopsis alkalitolerans]TNC23522.1 hypothetical protein FG385_21060 [Amycolatopsis alkalitolerans]